MIHSLYASPKLAVSQQRKQASLPGSPSEDRHHGNHLISPLFIDNMPGPWKSDSGDSTARSSTRKLRPSSSMIIEDASPPLPWQESNHRFESGESLDASQRFGMDAISGGAFAMPANEEPVSYSQHLPPVPDTPVDTNNHGSLNAAQSLNHPTEPKKKRWGPKSQTAASEHAIADAVPLTISGLENTRPSNVTDATVDAQPTFLQYDTPAGELTPAIEPITAQSMQKPSKDSRTKSSAFGLRTLSESSTGIVSGLTSLKNSIMIPALPSAFKGSRTNGSQPNSLAASQSSLLDFVTEDPPQPSSSASSSVFGSPSLFRSVVLGSGSEYELTGRGSEVNNLILERGHDSGAGVAHPRGRRSNVEHGSSRRFSSSSSSHRQQQQPPRRRRMDSQNSAAKALSLLESEFQQLIRRQGQLSAHKIELSKELLSLYSRRNINERRQEEAAQKEQFEDAAAVATTIAHVHERISKLEGIYSDVDRSLWACKKRQDELARSITEMHQAVMLEAEDLRQTKEKEREESLAEAKMMRENVLNAILTGREALEKEKSDLALGQDFLGKDEAELQERMQEETKAEQDEVDELLEKREAVRNEIKELRRKLEELDEQDKDLSRSIGTLQQKIRSIGEQFDGKVRDVAREKRKLEGRVAEMRQKSAFLDKQESNAQKAAHQVEAVHEEMTKAIQSIIVQKSRLESVHQLFESELSVIQKLRLEEEMFREKEAGWVMRANSLDEDLRKSEARISDWTSKMAANQKTVQELEQEMQAAEKRISMSEALKVLSVQRRDFKQAAQCSNEIAKGREAIIQQKQELEQLLAVMTGPTQVRLDELQSEHETLKTFVKGEEAALFKDIQSVTSATLLRLNAFVATSSSVQAGGAGVATEAEGSEQASGEGESLKLSRILLEEMVAEIESMREVSRIRFGREETVPVSDSVQQEQQQGSSSVIPTAQEDAHGVDKDADEEKRHTCH
ncbi:hypothetical protein BGZ70_002269 [Mortierella alpina]|uniref:Uncharacterized protein n=1 Tax=Mortierella alpina TaxID=64518 RepID=A0A9P6IUF6_MORAP|nr:hypothetical protein BGZ70_002269 [Mortierella alpina]